MLRVGVRRLVGGTAKVVGGTAALGGTGVVAYAATEQGQGLRREMKFWHGVAPVVFDYYWNLASSSPYVKYQKYMAEKGGEHNKISEEERKLIRRQKIRELDERHAPEILNVLLSLKGLYIKLGQVLSVTTLPVPDPYREKFRSLQSDVPGWETFDDKVKPVLEQELGKPVEEIFSSIDPVPCGAASIGQAHKAVLKKSQNEHGNEKEEQVIIKVQYPDAAWQIPADIQCVGDLLKICVFFGVVDETAANLSFNEFSRQFIAELDYDQERQHLEEIYQSSIDPTSPYQRRGVVVPRVYEDYCTSKVITMSYLPGPKLEEEARRQLEALGIDTKKGLRGLVKAPIEEQSTTTNDVNVPSKEAVTKEAIDGNNQTVNQLTKVTSFKRRLAQMGMKVVRVDSLFGTVRLARRVQLWLTAATVKSVNLFYRLPLLGWLVPSGLEKWADEHGTVVQQARRLELTKDWIDALFDVHGHQIFNLGCFNADAHPGNILVLEEDSDRPKLGLIDFGQCKRLTSQEQYQIARLLVSVANNDSDEIIASNFRVLGIETKNDSTEYLAKFAKLMFGPLQSYHLDHSWHKELHRQDAVTYFPNQLSMVYRTSMLLRGLAVSLQFNVSVGELWKSQAQEAIDRFSDPIRLLEDAELAVPTKPIKVIRRMTTKDLVEDLGEHVVKQ